MPSWPWFAALCVIVVIAWLIWEYHRASLQPDEAPEDREQFAQGSLGKCRWWGSTYHRPGCQEWAVENVRNYPLCGHCLVAGPPVDGERSVRH